MPGHHWVPFEEPPVRGERLHPRRETASATSPADHKEMGGCSPGLICACALPWEPLSRIPASSRAAALLLPRRQFRGERLQSRAAEKDVVRLRRQCPALHTPPPQAPSHGALRTETTFPRGLGGSSPFVRQLTPRVPSRRFCFGSVLVMLGLGVYLEKGP